MEEDSECNILSPEDELNIRLRAWNVWLNVGIEATSPERVESSPPTQHFLTALMQVFPDVFLPIKLTWVIIIFMPKTSALEKLVWNIKLKICF